VTGIGLHMEVVDAGESNLILIFAFRINFCFLFICIFFSKKICVVHFVTFCIYAFECCSLGVFLCFSSFVLF